MNNELFPVESAYTFEGDTIKLKQKDFDKAQRLYPNLNLMAELEQLDVELYDTKKWWPVMHAKLNYRNKVAPKRAPAITQGGVAYMNATRSTRDIHLSEEMDDRSWAD